MRKGLTSMTWIHIVLISVTTFALLAPFIIQFLSVHYLKKKLIPSENFLNNNLRYIVYVVGQVRAGKTTFSAGYTNIRTKYLIDKVRRQIDFACLAFPKVPFNEINEILIDDFEKGYKDSFKEAKKLIAKDMPFADYSEQKYNNHVTPHPVPFMDILEDYINAIWAYARNDYVYYYGKAFYSQITNNDAMDYDPSMLYIKDRLKDKNYHIFPYSIIFEDERQMSGLDNQKSKEYAKADTGSADFKRLIGQIGKESIYYVTTNQEFGTDINRERNLATEIVEIEKSTAINPYFLQRFIISLYELPFKIVKWFDEKKDRKNISPLMKLTNYRKHLAKAMLWRKYWGSKGFIRFKGIIYHNANDVNKSKQFALKGVDELRVIIPLKYCYGSVNTFQFYSVQRELLSRSTWTLKDEPKTITAEDLADRILKKSNEKLKGGAKRVKSKA